MQALILIPAAAWYLFLTSLVANVIVSFIPLDGRKRFGPGLHPDIYWVWGAVMVVVGLHIWWVTSRKSNK